jgi:hypothetical protein
MVNESVSGRGVGESWTEERTWMRSQTEATRTTCAVRAETGEVV